MDNLHAVSSSQGKADEFHRALIVVLCFDGFIFVFHQGQEGFHVQVVFNFFEDRVGDVGQLEGDISNYENAMTNFTKLINGMSPTRQTGSLYKKRMEIHELADQIRHLENVEEDLVKLENRKNDLINIQREREKDLKKALREDADADLYAATGTKTVTDSNADADSYADSGADSYDIGQDDISPALFSKILLFASIGVAGILILASIFIYFYYNRMLPALYAGVTGVGILFIGVTVNIIIEQIRSDVRVRADAKQKANDEYIDRLMAEYDGAVKDCAICRTNRKTRTKTFPEHSK